MKEKKKKRPGFLVKTSDGKTGRTYHDTPPVEFRDYKKTQVFLEKTVGKYDFRDTATLYLESQVEVIGFMD